MGKIFIFFKGFLVSQPATFLECLTCVICIRLGKYVIVGELDVKHSAVPQNSNEPAGSHAHRLVPLSDASYVSQLEMMLATLKIPLERRKKRSGRTEKARIWEITDRTVSTWLSEAVEAAAADGVTFSVPVTPHTFRHSYAMHMLYAGIPLKVLQSLMVHKSVGSTEVYTKVFVLDVAARHRVQFAMPESDAVAWMKQLNRG